MSTVTRHNPQLSITFLLSQRSQSPCQHSFPDRFQPHPPAQLQGYWQYFRRGWAWPWHRTGADWKPSDTKRGRKVVMQTQFCIQCSCPSTNLHATIVDDHGTEVNPRIELCHILTLTQEESIWQLPAYRKRRAWHCPVHQTQHLHDVGFVNSCDKLAIMSLGIVEGILGYPSWLISCDDLQALHDSRDTLWVRGCIEKCQLSKQGAVTKEVLYLMFKSTVFSLGVFANDDNVHVLIPA